MNIQNGMYKGVNESIYFNVAKFILITMMFLFITDAFGTGGGGGTCPPGTTYCNGSCCNKCEDCQSDGCHITCNMKCQACSPTCGCQNAYTEGCETCDKDTGVITKLYDISTQFCCAVWKTDCSQQTTGTPCNNDCQSCCNGHCCNISNCEICKNGTTCVRAVPTNMQEVLARDLGNGILYFEYIWGSTTGETADLTNCSVRELVNLEGGNPSCMPPPWYPGQCRKNPFDGCYTAGTTACLWDYHTPGAIVRPYQPASYIAIQTYQYHCGPSCCMGDNVWETLLDIGFIVRAINSEGGDLWRYSIIKSGAYAEIFPLP